MRPILLVVPREAALISLCIGISFEAADRDSDLSGTPNFEEPRFRREAEFLQGLKYDYGYVGKEDADKRIGDPHFAYYGWRRDNRDVSDGPISSTIPVSSTMPANIIMGLQLSRGILPNFRRQEQIGSQPAPLHLAES